MTTTAHGNTLHESRNILGPERMADAVRTRLGRMGLLLGERGRDHIQLGERTYHVIDPETVIDGGVYVDRASMTAVSVDFERDDVLQNTYNTLMPALQRVASDVTRLEGLRGLATVISRRFLPYDTETIESMAREDSRRSTKQLSEHLLGEYIDSRAGVCAQQALLAAAVLEHATRSKVLPPGATSSFLTEHDVEPSEAHAYAKLSINGDTWIIDPTQPRDRMATKIENTAKQHHDT